MFSIPRLPGKLIEQFVDKGSKRDVVIGKIQKAYQLYRRQLLLKQKRDQKQCIPPSVTYRRELPNLKDILTKHWYILQTNQRCGKAFSTFPAIVFKTDTSLRQNIFTNVVHNNKKIIKSKINHQKGKCVPCHSKRCLCFQESRHCFNKNIQRH